ncbi:hypothetical protein AAFF_G00058550 [Aldrovandia affinis]|uniref:Uncharacterized protein n=1 Tax=Aldrovandia affinis TaxID=143900 RepID=A0AAD7S2N6_9TELE|nr:hypothetical protein AAFF_G00058550 [Aldrovandia affinis]
MHFLTGASLGRTGWTKVSWSGDPTGSRPAVLLEDRDGTNHSQITTWSCSHAAEGWVYEKDPHNRVSNGASGDHTGPSKLLINDHAISPNEPSVTTDSWKSRVNVQRRATLDRQQWKAVRNSSSQETLLHSHQWRLIPSREVAVGLSEDLSIQRRHWPAGSGTGCRFRLTGDKN